MSERIEGVPVGARVLHQLVLAVEQLVGKEALPKLQVILAINDDQRNAVVADIVRSRSYGCGRGSLWELWAGRPCGEWRGGGAVLRDACGGSRSPNGGVPPCSGRRAPCQPCGADSQASSLLTALAPPPGPARRLKPENLILTAQRKRFGYRYHREEQAFLEDPSTAAAVLGSGFSLCQLAWLGDAFYVSDSGELVMLMGQTLLERFAGSKAQAQVEWLVCRRARDLALLTPEGILDLPQLAFAVYAADRHGANYVAQVRCAAQPARARRGGGSSLFAGRERVGSWEPWMSVRPRCGCALTRPAPPCALPRRAQVALASSLVVPRAFDSTLLARRPAVAAATPTAPGGSASPAPSPSKPAAPNAASGSAPSKPAAAAPTWEVSMAAAAAAVEPSGGAAGVVDLRLAALSSPGMVEALTAVRARMGHEGWVGLQRTLLHVPTLHSECRAA
jgi:hypothetical protein